MTKEWTRSPLLAAAMALIMALAVAACGGDDDPAGDDATSTATQDDSGTAPPAVPGLEVPADYPLPVPAGGSLQRVLMDEANGTSNVAVLYPAGSFDSLVATFDAFFADVADSIEAGPADGLASWQSSVEGYSVVITDQADAVQVVLQTGV